MSARPLVKTLPGAVFDHGTGTIVPSPAVVAIIQAQADRLQRARDILGEIEGIETRMVRDRDALLTNAWYLGEVLCAMKDDVGHGRWLWFVAGQLPQVGERNAQRCMAFFKDNPKSENSSDLTFSVESVRKFMLGYIPVKERPDLEGDAHVPPAAHHLTFINHFSKWDRQHTLGHAGPYPPVDQMRRDFQTTVERQTQLLGRDWMLEVVRSVVATADVRG